MEYYILNLSPKPNLGGESIVLCTIQWDEKLLLNGSKWNKKIAHTYKLLPPDSCPLAGTLTMTFCRSSTAFRVNLTWFKSLL